MMGKYAWFATMSPAIAFLFLVATALLVLAVPKGTCFSLSRVGKLSTLWYNYVSEKLCMFVQDLLRGNQDLSRVPKMHSQSEKVVCLRRITHENLSLICCLSVNGPLLEDDDVFKASCSL